MEREDSGIDSEDAACIPGMRLPGGNNIVDWSSSDDEFIIGGERNNAKNMQDGWVDFVGMDYPMVPLVSRDVTIDSQHIGCSSPDSSSPLYEVELTASDEDDDTSNVEVVIPITNQQHKKVSTGELLLHIFYDILCCLPNRRSLS
ncbi:PREDICTED: uncharacterized protein LOC106102610 isoform X2 [Papilio polytes]|nr:PREDICTED: uncharacterized protein LOC106102610 isoform X2 [Papilio polytes]XP_013137603.1 PREDICTED: uncharacterized protein LOC106102610 isoform X2 [Papilio polytes]